MSLGGILALALVGFGNWWLWSRFEETARSEAEVALALREGSLLTELQRNAAVPLLLAQDPVLTRALASGDHSFSSQRLISVLEEVGAKGILLLDATGRTVAASDRNLIGTSRAHAPYFTRARDLSETEFSYFQAESGAMVFAYSRQITLGGQAAGVIVVLVDFAKIERAWARLAERVFVTDRRGTVLLASQPAWRAKPEAEALALLPPEAPVMPPATLINGPAGLAADTLRGAGAVLRADARLGFNGWRITSFTPLQPVISRMSAALALQAVLVALLLAAGFYARNRRERAQSARLRRDAAALRALNTRLEREITERQRAEANLEIAEQTLEQSSKLAALGEMSAAVSHELNQPLAAMKTYLAGARLLMQRDRPEEAEASLRRIDDLIERMGTLTRQLKSHARRGDSAASEIDLRDALEATFAIMAPQVKAARVTLRHVMPARRVPVMANQLRVEQVLINLLRNALDAVQDVEAPQIDVLLSLGETATLSVRDNGHGIADLEALFEPFYTTKAPGDGTGLGLAIASGIVAEFGGALTARNGASGGAVFELQLPIASAFDAGAQDISAGGRP